MRSHAARGEKGMAIQAYDRCRTVLADLMDAAPSQETQKLLAEIRGPAGSRMPSRPRIAGRVANRRRSPASRRRPAAGPRRRSVRETPAAEAARDRAATELRHARGGAHIGVLPLQLDRHQRGGSASGARTGRGDHHRALAVPLDVRGGLQLARPLRRRTSGTRARSGARFGLDFLRRRHDPESARPGAHHASGCWTCAPATRSPGRGASTARRTICCPCRTRSPPRWWRRSIPKSC